MAMERKLKKGQYYILEGEHPRSIAFVSKGLFRYFYCGKNSQEFTKGFFSETTFISSYSGLLQNRPSYFTIECLEDSVIQEIAFSDWKSLLSGHSCWSQILIHYLQMGYCTKEQREREFLLFSAEERYNSFLEQFPGYDRRIKQYQIASYLGISPVSLSRIRKNLNR